MIKITHIREIAEIELPQEVISVIQEAVTILDEAYGEDRLESGYGGYVLVAEPEDDLSQLRAFGVDIKADLPEYVDIITCSNGQVFTSRLFLLGSDFGIVVIIPELMTKK